MDDDKSTDTGANDSVDTGSDAAEDTSTNEEAQDTDTELEDIEVTEQELDDTSEEDDTEEPEESDDDSPASDDSKETEEESKEDADEEQSAEERKRHNDEMAKQRIAEREAREKAKREQQEKYLEEAEDNRDLALRQLQIDAYNNRVERNVSKLESGIDKAVANIDLFTKGSQKVRERLARSLDKFEAMHVKRDQNGDPVEVTGDVYQYLQQEAADIRDLLGDGALAETKAKNKAKARTDTLPTRAPKEKSDSDLAEFDAAWDRYN